MYPINVMSPQMLILSDSSHQYHLKAICTHMFQNELIMLIRQKVAEIKCTILGMIFQKRSYIFGMNTMSFPIGNINIF